MPQRISRLTGPPEEKKGDPVSSVFTLLLGLLISFR